MELPLFKSSSTGFWDSIIRRNLVNNAKSLMMPGVEMVV